jgi:nicotinamidase/pyrazinamidase
MKSRDQDVNGEPKVAVEPEKSALLVVDLQPDFMPGGALPVVEGDQIVQPVSELARSGLFRIVLATQDWHPGGHISFASAHPGRHPFDVIQLYGHPQMLWPDHCVQGTAGAEIHAALPMNGISAIIRKGTDPRCDSYSGFRNNWNARGERPPTGLAGYLEELGITDLFLCGLARDFCVKWSAEDAADAGFHASLVWDLTRSVDPSSDESVRGDLASRGVRILNSRQLA